MITQVEITRTQPLANAMSFGATGSYLKISGIAKGEVDPTHSSNRSIVDIDMAPRNARGNVEYAADFVVLRPAEFAKGNGRILYAATNRGNKQLFTQIGDALTDGGDLQTATDFGNALPLRLGFTIVWSGWDADPPKKGRELLALRAPVATDSGKTISGRNRDEFVYRTRTQSDGNFRLSYEALNLDPAQARLTVRQRRSDERREIARDGWRFVDSRTIQLLPEGAKPEVGALYEFHYTAKDPRVLGLGYAAIRDLVSYLRHDANAKVVTGGSITHTLAIGFSQGGRCLTDLIALDFNRDETGRRVFDGVLAHTAGTGRVFLNYRFGQPFRTRTRHQDHDYPEGQFPFSTATLSDPVTGKTGSLFRGDGSDPLLIHTNTSNEYWQKGASLRHTDPLGQHDVELPRGARVYMIAGTQHGGKAGIVSDVGPCRYPRNPHNPMPILRALLVALDQWVTNGRTPPASRVPSIAEETLVEPRVMGFPDLPGGGIARENNDVEPPGDWVDPRESARNYRPLVCRVDADGNEVAGVRTPDIAVPLGTYTGWNLYRKPYPEGELADRDGSFIAFPVTSAERIQSGDPRLSLDERYRSAEDYVNAVKEAANALLDDRLLLPEDAAAYIERAGSAAQLFRVPGK